MIDNKILSQSRYNQFATSYVTSLTHAKGSELEQLVAIAEPQSHWKMLDVATGGGHTALKFALHVAHITATDLTLNMLLAARDFIITQGITNVDFRLADAENLPFLDNQFDLVTCRIAAHHFPNTAKFVMESARVLKSGGILIVQDHVLPEDTEAGQYVDEFERLRDSSHHQAFTSTEWQAMFTEAQLTIYHTEEIIKRHKLIQWAKRQGNNDALINKLQNLLSDASPAVSAWMLGENVGTLEASFVNHHIIIAGRKS